MAWRKGQDRRKGYRRYQNLDSPRPFIGSNVQAARHKLVPKQHPCRLACSNEILKTKSASLRLLLLIVWRAVLLPSLTSLLPHSPLPRCPRTLLCQSHRGSEWARSSSNASDVNLCAERLPPIHFCRAGRPSKSLDSASPQHPAASRQFFFLHLIGSFLHLSTAFVTYPAHRRPDRSTLTTKSNRSSQIGQTRDLRTDTLPLGTQWKSVNIFK